MHDITARVGGLTLLVAAGLAGAADWDHDANIEAAVVSAVSVYRSSGSEGLERAVAGCYRDIDVGAEFDDRLRAFEYCAGMDFSAFRLDRRDGDASARAYFAPEEVVTRVGQLRQFLTDANVGNQVVRAWSRASVQALGRNGYPELAD
jgi:hypothetical protein